jgi:tetratricopeptide (TPR) repeat protein
MQGRVIGWLGGVVAATAAVALAGYVMAVGLDKADKLASVIGAFVGLAGWALAIYGWMRDRRTAGLAASDGPVRESLSQRRLSPADDRSSRDAVPVGRAGGVVPRQLPAAVSGFAGRTVQLRALTELLDQATGAGSTVVISAVAGTAGIGKTALAVHWAHQVADRFPDGQLYVNLRGFDPAGPPVPPAEAVRGFLDAFEVPPERIPLSLDAQAALYRSLLADRTMLVVLDNARDADQIRPLLPGSPGCVVLVTSRNRLTSLIAAEGAHPLPLDLLTTTEARQLLTHRLGADRIAAESPAVEEIITLCARLPLALTIVAARATALAESSLAALAGELRAVSSEAGLEAFDGGDPTTNVRAVFSWSYQQLTAPAARLFRLLGLHPGPDVTAPAAAGLARVPVVRARSALAELARAHMIAEHTPGRFAFHDLLRAYATEQSHALDSESERQAAVHRMLDHYLHTAHTAALLMYPGTPVIAVAPPQTGVTPEKPADYAAASAWFDAEYAVLLAVIDQAATRYPKHAWQLAWTLRAYFRRHGHWHDWIATHDTALTAAQQHADRYGEAHTLAGLGHACGLIGRYDEAHTHLRQALPLFEDVGDQAGQADTHHKLGSLAEYQDRYEEAIGHTQQALLLFQTAGHRRGQAGALNNLGWYHALLGDPEQTLTYCRQALDLQREIGDWQGEAAALDSIGYAHHLLGHHQEAVGYFERALALQRELGDRHHQATNLDHLGDALQAAGNLTAARTAWRRALEILDQLSLVPRMGAGYADPDIIRAKLHRHP